MSITITFDVFNVSYTFSLPAIYSMQNVGLLAVGEE